jgi:Ni/Co efflux regulator RcnB
MKHFASAAVTLSLLCGAAYAAPINDPSHQTQFSSICQRTVLRNDSRRFGDRVPAAPQWLLGERLPGQCLQQQYVVRDLQQRHLRVPPSGYRWLRNDDQYLLEMTGTGVIADIVSQDRYPNDQQWSRGERLSSEFRSAQYLVADWRSADLTSPSTGTYWVRVNKQYFLVAKSSGLIAEVVFDDQSAQ